MRRCSFLTQTVVLVHYFCIPTFRELSFLIVTTNKIPNFDICLFKDFSDIFITSFESSIKIFPFSNFVNPVIHFAKHPFPPQICAIEFYYIRASIKRLGQVAGAVRARRALTLGRHVSACATILRLRAPLYLRESHQCVRQYIVTSLERLGQVAGAVEARRARHRTVR